MKIDISFLPAIAAAFLLTFARIGTMVMLLPGVGELNLPARVRLGHRAGAHRHPAAVAREGLCGRSQGARAGDRTVVSGADDRRGAGLDRKAGDLGVASGGLGGRPAIGPRVCHGDRSDAEPAGAAGRQFPLRARHHVDLCHRHASSGHRRAQRQLQYIPPRRDAAHRRRGAAHHPRDRDRRSASACSWRRRFWCSGYCSISASACSAA